MNLNKLIEHIEVKYELTDINGIRLVPKDIVVYTMGNSLFKGIVTKINKTTVTIYTLSNVKHLINANHTCIITELIKPTIEYEQFLNIYTKNKESKTNINSIRYSILIWKTDNPLPEHKNMDCGIFVLPINLENTNRLNKEVWWKTLAKFLEAHNNSIKYNQFWILNKDKTYSKLTEAISKNILTIHPNDTSDFINNYHLENKFLPFVKPLLFDETPQYKLWIYCNDVPQYKLWGDCHLDSYRVYFYRNVYWFYRITQREDLKTLLTENVINLLS
jgi:hypothetical protein